MSATPRRLRLSAVLIAGAAGFTWFLLRFGLAALDVRNLGWVMSGDWSQNEIGWLMYRQAPSGFPFGSIPNLLYPVGSSVALTDATPLFSLLLKPFQAALPESFQFLGAWLLLCFVLQGVAGAVLTSAFSRDRWVQAAGGVLFTLSPVLDIRIGHASLCAQFLVLGALWLCLRPEEPGARVGGWLAGAIAWSVLAAIIHPYLWAMVAVLLLSLHLRLGLERRAGARALIASAAAMLGLALLVFWLFGLVGNSVGAGGAGFGAYNSDLLTFFNSMGRSRFLPGIHAGGGQYEGFGYLGLGGLLLVAVALWRGYPRRGKLSTEDRRRWGPTVGAALALGVFAIGSVVTIAGHRVFSMHGLYRPLAVLTGPFRASGRFIWPLHYLILVAALAVLFALFERRERAAAAVLGVLVLVQAVDFHRANVDTRPTDRWNQLRSPRWDQLAEGRAHLVMFPAQLHVGGGETCPHEDAHPEGLYLSANWLAYRHRMTVNSAYVSRVNSKAMVPYCEALLRTSGGALDPDALYLVARGWERGFLDNAAASCERLDGELACVARNGRAPPAPVSNSPPP